MDKQKIVKTNLAWPENPLKKSKFPHQCHNDPDCIGRNNS